MIHMQVVLLLYGVSGGKIRPVLLSKYLLQLPGGRVTGEGVATFTGSLLSDHERSSNKT